MEECPRDIKSGKDVFDTGSIPVQGTIGVQRNMEEGPLHRTRPIVIEINGW